jgi:hypothetical protein
LTTARSEAYRREQIPEALSDEEEGEEQRGDEENVARIRDKGEDTLGGERGAGAFAQEEKGVRCEAYARSA